jgi:hypothetical protein
MRKFQFFESIVEKVFIHYFSIIILNPVKFCKSHVAASELTSTVTHYLQNYILRPHSSAHYYEVVGGFGALVRGIDIRALVRMLFGRF